MAYRDYSFYRKLFRRWKRKHGGAIRSSTYETTRGYLKAEADPDSSTGAKKNSGIWHLEEIHAAKADFVPAGEHVLTSTGTNTWTCPAGVTSVCVVCVGGGGGGNSNNGSGGAGGGGGGLGWKNDIPVTPGQTYTVVVGSGGARGVYTVGSDGGDSYFINATTVKGGGGEGAYSGRYAGGGGTYVGDGGGNGGGLSGRYSGTVDSLGGCGAGGYSGTGGQSFINTSATAGTGGAGGGGGAGGSSDAAGAGGGVGLYGQGSNGAAGSYSGSNGSPGAGGSGGANGSALPGSTARPSNGGAYGGGGGGAEVRNEHGSGAQGAVRIIWGEGRAFPSTNVDEASSDGNVSTN